MSVPQALSRSIDLKGRVGRQKKSVYLYTNDPTNRIVRLCMSDGADHPHQTIDHGGTRRAVPSEPCRMCKVAPGRQIPLSGTYCPSRTLPYR
ncbi:MAG: hypothetical protein KAI66_12315 [Lentisphaeria bacterium]|nr:hypothetical protein [Lentisphaeria bacterium]